MMKTRLLLGLLSLQQAVEALEKLNLTEEEKRKIRWENANRLLSLEPAGTKPK